MIRSVLAWLVHCMKDVNEEEIKIRKRSDNRQTAKVRMFYKVGMMISQVHLTDIFLSVQRIELNGRFSYKIFEEVRIPNFGQSQ